MTTMQVEISSDPARLDLDLVYGFLSTSYWAAGRPRAVVERSVRHSLCFGAYSSGQQVGFGRAITDRALFAYIADVFVVTEWRGRGIGKTIVSAMLDDSDLSGLQVILLRTRDAHDLYRRFGFGQVSRPEEFMARYCQPYFERSRT